MTYESLLDAAARLLVAHGYAALTTNHVAETAGVSIGSLYEYFPDKDVIVAELARRTIREMVVEIAKGLEGALALPPIEGLRRWMETMFAVVRSRRRLVFVLSREVPFVRELDEYRALDETLLVLARRGRVVMKQPVSEAMIYLVTVMASHAIIESVVARPRHLSSQEIEDTLVGILSTLLFSEPSPR